MTTITTTYLAPTLETAPCIEARAGDAVLHQPLDIATPWPLLHIQAAQALADQIGHTVQAGASSRTGADSNQFTHTAAPAANKGAARHAR